MHMEGIKEEEEQGKETERPVETNSAPNCLLLAFLALSQITLVC